MIRRNALVTMLGVAALSVATHPGYASLVTMNDRNTEVQTDLNATGEFFFWEVDGTNHLDREWFWIRVNDDTRETKISALDKDNFLHYDGNLEPGEDRLYVRWYDPQDRFEMTLDQVVTGGPAGSAVSDVTQTVRIVNQTDAPLEVNLFELANFDLLGTEAGDTIEVISENVIMHTELNSFIRETYTSHSPTTTQVSLVDTIFDSLNDDAITNLDGTVGPFTGADVEYGVQWTTTIPVGGVFIVTKDLFLSAPDSIVPEPASASLLSLAGLALLAVRRRRS
jgi:hypothetical protein